MAAMRRAVDEGRTNVVSSIQAESSELPASKPQVMVGGAVNAELASARASVAGKQAIDEWFEDKARLTLGSCGTPHISRVNCIGNAVTLYSALNPPKETARRVREALHGKNYIYGGAARNVRLNVSAGCDLITDRLILNILDEKQTFLFVSNGEPVKIVSTKETTAQYAKSSIDVVRSNKRTSPNARNSPSISTIKNK